MLGLSKINILVLMPLFWGKMPICCNFSPLLLFMKRNKIIKNLIRICYIFRFVSTLFVPRMWMLFWKYRNILSLIFFNGLDNAIGNKRAVVRTSY